MRILYLDIDSLRPDHLGCYGYHRATSPNIDQLAAEGIRFDRCHASDTPCLPSRTAFISGRFGLHTGVVSHGGQTADPSPEGRERGFQSTLGVSSLPSVLWREARIPSASISTFADRHSAFHWNGSFHEVHNLGTWGVETADQVTAVAADWLSRHGRRDRWFLHVNFWDPHRPYRAPPEYGEPFAEAPLPGWLTEEVRARHWQLPGPCSAREMAGFTPEAPRMSRADLPFADLYPGLANGLLDGFERQPVEAGSMSEVRRMFDGYDTGIRFADDHIGRILNELADLGVLDDTAIIVSADHGENLGELNVYGDHQTADAMTTRLPMIVRWPGLGESRTDRGLHYQVDVAATMVELLGAPVPEHWDGRSFARSLQRGEEGGREYLVTSHGAWTAQRAVLFDEYICIRTHHDGFHGFPEVMLFDLGRDPHEQHDLADDRGDLVAHARGLLEEWQTAAGSADPMRTLLEEGGPWHVRGQLDGYLARLRSTGRSAWAEILEGRHAWKP